MGLASSKSGSRAEVVDRSTRKVIERAGYGKYFTHRTGHGLGLEVHEQPWIKQGNSLPLDIGMIFTIEPGVYLEGKFGVRIEDNVMITTHGTENITKLDHDLIRI